MFDKTYDASGKILKEIVFSFNDDIGVGDLPSFTFDMLVESKGRVVYLINKGATKNGVADTAFRLYLNSQGRPDSCIGNTKFIPSPDTGAESEYYYYKDSRFLAVKDELSKYSFKTIALTRTDTMTYDSYENPLSFRGNSYQYDSSMVVAFQFLCDDFTGGDELFYLLEYLGYFPEVTSPVNIRTIVHNITLGPGNTQPEAAHQFDKQGRLISYTLQGLPQTITWNNK